MNDSSTSSYFSQILAAISFSTIQYPSIFNSSAAENITLQLSTFVLQFQPPAFQLFCILSNYINKSTLNSMVCSIVAEVNNKILLEKPILLNNNYVENPLIMLKEKNFNKIKTTFIHSRNYIDSLPNAFKNKQIVLPESENIADYIGKEASDYITLIVKNVCDNKSLSSIFLNSFILEAESKAKSPHFFNILSGVILVSSKTAKYHLNVFSTDRKLHKYIFNPSINLFSSFDEKYSNENKYLYKNQSQNEIQNENENTLSCPKETNEENNTSTINDNKNFFYINTHRNSFMEIIHYCSADSLFSLLEFVYPFPNLFVETLARILSYSDMLIDKIVENPEIINLILKISYHYQMAHFTKELDLKIIEFTRSQIFSLFTFLFNRAEIMNLLFSNQESSDIYLNFISEKAQEQFIFQSVSQCILTLQEKSMNNLFNTLFNLINILIKEINSSDDLVLLTNIVMVVNDISAHQIKPQPDNIQVTENCSLLCHYLPNLDMSMSNQNYLRATLTFLASMSKFFEITDLEIESIISIVDKFKENEFQDVLYINFVQLLAGECITTFSSAFIIQQPHVVKLLIRVYADSVNFHDVLNLFISLCQFSRKNIHICHDFQVDMFIIGCLEKAKISGSYDEESMKLLLNLFNLISSYKTDSKTVFRFISLLSPIDESHVSRYQPLLISTLNNIVDDSMKEPLKYFLLDGRVLNSQQQQSNFPDIEKGITFTTWLYLENNSVDYQPNLFTLYITKNFLIRATISGNVAFGLIDDCVKEAKGKMKTDLPLNRWMFFVMSISISNGNAFFTIYVDCEEVGLFRIQNLTYDFSNITKVSLSLGGGSIPSSSFYGKMASTGIFPYIEIDDIRSIYGMGICRYEPQYNVNYYEFFLSYGQMGIYTMTDFMRILINHCSINILLPLLQDPNLVLLSDKEITPFDQFDATLQLFSSLLQFSEEIQLSFCHSNGFEVFSYLIKSRWLHHYSYKTYVKIYQLLENIKCIELQYQMFQNLLVNFNILCKIDAESHHRIIKHWEQTLFPTFPSLSKKVYSFQYILSVLRLYYWYTPIEKLALFKKTRNEFNVTFCRKKIINILVKYAEDELHYDDFSYIVSHIVSCTDEKQSLDLIDLINTLIYYRNINVDFKFNTSEMMSFMNIFFTIPNVQAHKLTISILLSLRSHELVPSEYSLRFLQGLLLVLPNHAVTEELFNYCYEMMSSYSELFPFCCDLAMKLKGDYIDIMISNLKIEYGWVWPLTLCSVSSIEQKKKIYTNLITNFEKKWSDFIMVFDIFFNENCDIEKSFFLGIIYDLILSKEIVATQSLLSSLFELTEFFVLYRKNDYIPSMISNLLLNTFEEKIISPEKNENCTFSFKNWNRILAQFKILTPSYKIGLRFDEDGKWLDSTLAEKIVSVYLEFNAQEYLNFILILISYLFRSGSESVSPSLFRMNLTEKEKTEHFDYIQMVIYNALISNRSQFFSEEINFEGIMNNVIYEELLTHKEPEFLITRYAKLCSDFKIFASRRERTVKKNFTPDFEKICSKSIEHITAFSLMQKKTLQNQKIMWNKLWFLLSADRAPWERKNIQQQQQIPLQIQQNAKELLVRDSNACFGFVPIKFAKSTQVLLNETMTKREASIMILQLPCDLIFPNSSKNAFFELYQDTINFRYQKMRSYTFNISTITHIFRRSKSSIQIYTLTGTNIYANFPQHNIDIIFNALDNLHMDSLVQIQKLNNLDFFQKQKLTDLWSMEKLSTYEYLLFLNNIGGRTFSSPDRYPIFPYLFCKEGEKIRDFSKTVQNTEKYQSPPMSRLIFQKFFEKIGSAGSEISDEGEAVPELYSMPELSSIDQMYAFRKVLESDDVSTEIHKWISLIWSSELACGIEPLFSGDHPPRGKRMQAYAKTTESISIVSDSIINSAFIKEISPNEYLVSLISVNSANSNSNNNNNFIVESIVGKDGQYVRKSFNHQVSNIIDVISIESLNKFVFVSKSPSVISIFNTKQPQAQIPQVLIASSISAVASDGQFYAIGCENANIVLFRDGQKLFSTQLYRDEIISCAVSATSHIIVSGIKDGSIVICSLVTGTIVHVIDIAPKIPRKIIVSPSFGFITVYATEAAPGSMKYTLLIYTVNGQMIRTMDIDFQIAYWYTWKSYSCFDYLAMATENGDIYFCENYYVDSIRQVLVGDCKVVAINYSNETSLMTVVRNDGSFISIPIML